MGVNIMRLSGLAFISIAMESTTTPSPDRPDGLCDPSFEVDGSIATIDFNAFDIYYNQPTLQGPATENITGWTHFRHSYPSLEPYRSQ